MSFEHKDFDEVQLSKCDKCGSEVLPDKISQDDPWYKWKIFGIGILVGGLLRMLFTWLQ